MLLGKFATLTLIAPLALLAKLATLGLLASGSSRRRGLEDFSRDRRLVGDRGGCGEKAPCPERKCQDSDAGEYQLLHLSISYELDGPVTVASSTSSTCPSSTSISAAVSVSLATVFSPLSAVWTSAARSLPGVGFSVWKAKAEVAPAPVSASTNAEATIR